MSLQLSLLRGGHEGSKAFLHFKSPTPCIIANAGSSNTVKQEIVELVTPRVETY